MPRSAWSTALAACVALSCIACSRDALRTPVSALDIREVPSSTPVDAAELEKGLATADDYDPAVLQRDLERIERYYRARGYYEAKVSAARVLDDKSGKVRIEIQVQPGQVVRLATLDISGLATLPFEHAGGGVTEAIIKAKNRLSLGEPFDEAEFDGVKAGIERVLNDGGFPFATVTSKARVDLVKHQAYVSYSFDSGPFAHLGEVRIVGLRDIPEGPVRDSLQIARGDVYSQTNLADARETLYALGVFSRVDIVPDLSHKDRAEVPIEVRVSENALRTLSVGGGASFDVLRLNLHLRTSWEHKNFLGGMRSLKISAVPGVDLYPTRFDGSKPVAPTRLLPENSLTMELHQPGFLEGRTLGRLVASYDIKPLLFALPAGTDPRHERIIGYHSLSATAGMLRDFRTHWHLWKLSPTQIFTVDPSYTWKTKLPFTYQSDLPPGLVDVNVSAPALNLTFAWLDKRPDQDPHLGVLVSNNVEVAGGIFQGNVSDIKLEPKIQGYFPITEQSVTFAWRLALGFLFPRNYGSTLNSATVPDPTLPAVIEDQEKLLLRAFYSGGPNSNRGYPLRSVGPHGPVGFLVPTGVNCAIPTGVGAPDPATAIAQLPSACIRPTGGFTLWETSAELRFQSAGNWGFVLFADASDVTRDVGHLRLNVPHVSVGPGLRYMTPVGPLRVDIGYRVPGLQAVGQAALSKTESGSEVGTLFGVPWLPVAINVQVGEAF